MAGPKPTRKALGAWYTPDDLVGIVTAGVVADFRRLATAHGWRSDRTVRVLDPACGDGRLLTAVRAALRPDGWTVVATGCDVDAVALASIDTTAIRTIEADALTHDWGDERFDVVVGNPPFLSQMASGTTRGGSSRHGGGPYANSAAEFLALSVRLADPGGSVIGLVLPQSILASRDAGAVRAVVDAAADHTWSWWRADQAGLFDAAVNVCALGFALPPTGTGDRRGPRAWTRVVTAGLGIPDVDPARIAIDGTLADRTTLRANFRDEYYALVPAVSDDADGPPFVTSGLIDPGRCRWGERPVRFARRTFERPRVDLALLEGRFADWARAKLVPKVLVANQTRFVEAVADTRGEWLPGVPITTLTPHPADPDPVRTMREAAAVLTSPIASASCWHAGGGTGMSSTAVRVAPGVLGQVPWPAGDLGPAVEALEAGDVGRCGAHVLAAFGASGRAADQLLSWWRPGPRGDS